MKYLLLLSAMFLAVVGQFALKKGISSSVLSFNLESIVKTLFSPMVFFGFCLYGFSSIIWLFVLQKFPLSVAYPSLALTYIFVLIFSVLFFKESFSVAKIAGVLLIFLGVWVINK